MRLYSTGTAGAVFFSKGGSSMAKASIPARDTTAEHEHDDQASMASDVESLVVALFPAREDLPRVPQQARSREKRDEILRAAAVMFAERGYSGTTSDDIAEAAGVSVGTFYNYFRNKRQVLVMLVIERIEDIFSNLQLARMDFSRGGDRETIRQAIAAALGGTQSALRRVWLELMSHDPELIPYQQIIRRHTLNKVEENLRQAVARGDTWPNLDVEATALAIFNLLDATSLHVDTGISDERMIEALTDMVHRAVFPPQPARST